MKADALFIDIGNTNLKWCLYRNRTIGEITSISHNSDLPDGLTTSLAVVDPCTVYIAAVAGSKVSAKVQQWFSEYWHVNAVLMNSEKSRFGVTNSYSEPCKLGVDRWLCMVGAWKIHQSGIVVVDCGTALTVDILDGNGVHQGGLITPGFRLMCESLLRETGISPVSLDLPATYHLGNSTVTAIEYGCLAAIVGTISHSIKSYRDSGGEGGVLITGGDAGSIQSHIDFDTELVQDLLFQGMACYASITKD